VLGLVLLNPTYNWGRQWASTFDEIVNAGHFLQESHGEKVVEILFKQIAEG